MSQRVIITPDENGNNPTVVADLSQNQTILPVNLSYHEATTIQTHNAVSVGATSASIPSNYVDCIGYDQIAVTMLNNATTSSNVDVHWSNDGVSTHAIESVIPIATGNDKRSGQISIKSRYAKVVPSNNDAVAHTMSAWAYLKA